jgi:hypothetical protein
VNLFYGFLSGSDQLPDEYNGEDVTSKLQKAGHVLGDLNMICRGILN